MRNKSEAIATPHPGSPAACLEGCTCPVLDNSYGAGRGGDGKRWGWYQSICPLHGFETDEPSVELKAKAKPKKPGFFGRLKSPAPPYIHWTPSTNPKGATESFLVSDFMETHKAESSVLFSGWLQRSSTEFRCPRCKRMMESPPNAKPIHHGCGVSFNAHGNHLLVWETGK